MNELIKPKEITITDVDGEKCTYIISRLPATVGREVLAKYPLTNMPKLGDYAASTEVMQTMMQYVAVPREMDEPLRLKTQALRDSHIPDGIAHWKLEAAMLEYNSGFFGSGGRPGLVGYLLSSISEPIMSMLTPFLQQLSQQASPPEQNSKPPST